MTAATQQGEPEAVWSRPPDGFRRGMRLVGIALRDARGPFALGIAGAVLYAAMTVAASIVLGWVVDEVVIGIVSTGAFDRQLVTLAVVTILAVALFKAIGVAGRRFGAYVAQYTLQSTYRRKVTRRYLQLPLEWHRRHPTGRLLSNANADVEAAFFLAAPLPMAVGATVLVFATAGLLVATDPVLSLIGFSVVPLLVVANWHYQKRMRYAAAIAQHSRGEVSTAAHESFDAALVVKTLGREDAETVRFAQRSELLRDRMIVVGRLRAYFDPIIEALPNVGILLVMIIGAMRVREGALTPGDMVLFAYLFRLLAIPIRIFGWMLGEMPRAIAGWERVSAVLDASGAMTYGTAPAANGSGARAVLESVTYHHPAGAHLDGVTAGRADELDSHAQVRPSDDADRRGVDAVDFTVHPGSTVALVGPTGAGKSTLAVLLARLVDPDEGRIALDGHDLRALDRQALAGRVGIVFQDTFLFDDTVRANIALGDDLRHEDVVAAAELAQAHEFINALDDGYDTLVGERGASLSGGQRQRIALARALVRRPGLLILDDATSAVDPAVEARILAGLASAELASSIVLVAYRLSTIQLADEIVFVDHGAVVARGQHEDLMRDVERYREIVTAYDDTAAAS